MALDLPFFRPGAKFREELTAERLNKMVAAIRSLEIQPGTNVRVSRTPGGTTLKASIPKQRGGGGANLSYPFGFYFGGTPSAPWFGLYPGTINGLIPGNITTTFGLPSTTTYTKYCVFDCDTDGYQVTNVDIAVEDSPPPPPTPTKGVASATFKILNHVIINGNAYRTMGPSCLIAVPQEILRTDKPTVSYGETPFDAWYAWVFAS